MEPDAPSAEEAEQVPAQALSSPAAMRAYIVERMVGQTGAPEDVTTAAETLGKRLAPLFCRHLAAVLPVPLEAGFVDATLLRLHAARPAEGGAVMVCLPLSAEAAVLALDAAGVGLAVGVMFGADPAMAPVALVREPSPIERDVAGVLLTAFAQALAEAGGFSLTLPIPALLAGQAMEREALRDVPAVALRFRLGGPEGGTLSLALPQRLVLRREEAGIEGAAADWSGHIGEELMRSAVSLQATMPLGRLTLGELAALEPGIVVPLDAAAPASARLAARGKTLFAGEFGQMGGRYTLLLGEPFDAAQDLMDTLVATR